MAKKFNGIIKVDNFLDGTDIYYTTKEDGVSVGPYAGFNLGLHVEDDVKSVLKNRYGLEKNIRKKLVWMNQTHSNVVKFVDYKDAQSAKGMSSGTEAISLGVEADGIVTIDKSVALCVLTADCLPLLLASEDKKVVAAVHCGWKGMQSGIIRNTIALMRRCTFAPIYAFIGPCIGPMSYEVGPELLEQFCNANPKSKEEFEAQGNGKYLCSLPGLCSMFLNDLGIDNIKNSNLDTYAEDSKFFSYRRENVTGRIASIISLN